MAACTPPAGRQLPDLSSGKIEEREPHLSVFFQRVTDRDDLSVPGAFKGGTDSSRNGGTGVRRRILRNGEPDNVNVVEPEFTRFT